MNKKTLQQLYSEHTGKVSDKWSLYLSEYNRMFSDTRDKPVRLLEIGIQNGGSLEIWSEYFGNALNLVGCDVNPDCASLSYEDPRIRVIVGDCNATEVLDRVSHCSPQFDIIIDDGSHLSSDIIKSFALYFPQLVEGGIYIAEDLHCSYWSQFEGGLFNPYSSISFFKRLADILSYEHWGIPKQRTDILHGIFAEYGCEVSEEVLSQVHSVEFINSMCVVRKAPSTDNKLGRRIIAGKTEMVVSGHQVLNGYLYQFNTTFDQSGNSWTARTIPPDEAIQKVELELANLQTSLNQAVTERDGQIASLNQAVTERDGQIASLNQAVTERDRKVDQIYQSRSWKVTMPFRFIGYQVRRVFAIYRFCLALICSFGGSMILIKKIIKVTRRDGMRGLVFRANNALRYYKQTGGRFPNSSQLNNGNSESLDITLVAEGPTITVIMPVYNTPIDMLSASIVSVIEQAYQNWELIIVDDKSTNPKVEKIINQFVNNDKRIKAFFRSENGNISKALNSGIELATGDYVAVLDHDDTLDPYALYWVALAILSNPSADYIYTDEDKISRNGQVCYGPFFKPDWSPEYILTMMYTCHLGVYRTSMLRNIGGYRSEFDGAQDFDLTLRFLRYTDRVVHIPHVLYHWRVWEQSTAQSPEAKPYAEGRARKALAEFLDSKNENYEIHDGPYPGHHRVKFLPKGVPLVSIIIPTANGTIDVKGVNEWHIDAVIQSILNITTYKNYEFIIVHNGNLLPDQEKFFAEQKNLKLIYYDSKVFSLSEKINLGSTYAKGEYLVIMNDDIRVISEDWLDLMVGMVQREGVGVVGPKLLFPDETIQHAGVVLLGGLPGHAYYQWPKNSDGYALGAKVDRNYLAVTGACAITPKWLFDKVGGYSLRYPLNYNDIDYCLKLHRMGYRSVYLANIELYHYEGVSKEGGRSVADLEIEKFLQDWSHVYQYDPYYNPNLSQYAPYQFG